MRRAAEDAALRAEELRLEHLGGDLRDLRLDLLVLRELRVLLRRDDARARLAAPAPLPRDRPLDVVVRSKLRLVLLDAPLAHDRREVVLRPRDAQARARVGDRVDDVVQRAGARDLLLGSAGLRVERRERGEHRRAPRPVPRWRALLRSEKLRRRDARSREEAVDDALFRRERRAVLRQAAAPKLQAPLLPGQLFDDQARRHAGKIPPKARRPSEPCQRGGSSTRYSVLARFGQVREATSRPGRQGCFLPRGG